MNDKSESMIQCHAFFIYPNLPCLLFEISYSNPLQNCFASFKVIQEKAQSLQNF